METGLFYGKQAGLCHAGRVASGRHHLCLSVVLLEEWSCELPVPSTTPTKVSQPIRPF